MKMELVSMDEIFESKYVPIQENQDKFEQRKFEINKFLKNQDKEYSMFQFEHGQYIARQHQHHMVEKIRNLNRDLQKQLPQPSNLAYQNISQQSNIRVVQDDIEVDDKIKFNKITESLHDFFEKDPLSITMKHIQLLPSTTKIFKKDLEKQLNKIDSGVVREQQALKDALTEQLNAKNYTHTNQFIDEVFRDTLDIDSMFTSTQHLTLKSKKVLDQQMKRESKWYEVPNFKPSQDPNDLTEIEFFRDLGPFQRLKDSEPFYNKLRKQYLDEMEEQDRHNQIFQLILYGMVAVEDINNHIPKSLQPKHIKLPKKQRVPKQSTPRNNQKQSTPRHNSKFNLSQMHVNSQIDSNSQNHEHQQTAQIENHAQLSNIESSVTSHDNLPYLDPEYVEFLQQQLFDDKSDESQVQDEDIEEELESSEDKNSTTEILDQIDTQTQINEQMQQDKQTERQPSNNNIQNQQTQSQNDVQTEQQISYIDQLIKQAHLLVRTLKKVWQKVEDVLIVKQRIKQELRINQQNRKADPNASNSSQLRSCNRKLENYLENAIDVFDQIYSVNQSLIKESQPPLTSVKDYLQRCTKIEHEDINEELKAKFLYRLVREYTHSIETQRQQRLNVQFKNQVISKVKRDLPSLSPSPEGKSARRTSPQPNSKLQPQKSNNLIKIRDFKSDQSGVQMIQGLRSKSQFQ